MQAEDIYKKLQNKFGDAVTEFKNEPPSDAFVVINADKIFDVSLFLRDDDELLFDYMKCLSGMDLGENLGVVYHLYSMKFAHHFVLKVIVPKAEPNVPTVERVWRTADWHERETYDLIGVNFVGHHNQIRILCPYDWEGHPLQKDYQTPEYYHGMKIPY